MVQDRAPRLSKGWVYLNCCNKRMELFRELSPSEPLPQCLPVPSDDSVQPSLSPTETSPPLTIPVGERPGCTHPRLPELESHCPHFTDGKTEVQGGEGHFELGGFLWIVESCSERQDATWAPFRREQNLNRILHHPLQQAHQGLYYLDRPFPLSEPQ